MLAVGQTLPTLVARQTPKGVEVALCGSDLSLTHHLLSCSRGLAFIPVWFAASVHAALVMAPSVRWRQFRASRLILASAVVPDREHVTAARPGNLRVGQLETVRPNPLGEEPKPRTGTASLGTRVAPAPARRPK